MILFQTRNRPFLQCDWNNQCDSLLCVVVNQRLLWCICSLMAMLMCRNCFSWVIWLCMCFDQTMAFTQDGCLLLELQCADFRCQAFHRDRAVLLLCFSTLWLWISLSSLSQSLPGLHCCHCLKQMQQLLRGQCYPSIVCLLRMWKAWRYAQQILVRDLSNMASLHSILMRYCQDCNVLLGDMACGICLIQVLKATPFIPKTCVFSCSIGNIAQLLPCDYGAATSQDMQKLSCFVICHLTASICLKVSHSAHVDSVPHATKP